MTILCNGEALIDMIPVATVDGGSAYQPCSGGAVFNTAIALGRLGVTTEFLTGLSSDLFGEQLKESLAQSHVSASLCKQSPLPTTLAFVRLHNGHATYHFYDENSAGRMFSLDDVKPIPSHIKAMFFGGISLAVEPCARTYEALAVRESKARVIMMDPNVRPGFIKDAEVYRARINTMLAHCDIVKVSDEDLAWLLPDVEGVTAQVKALLAKGPKILVLTKGSEGATSYLADGRQVSVAASKAKVVDTVGAGDTFNAGFLASLAEGDLLAKEKIAVISDQDLSTAMSLAAKCAAVTVARKGANPPWRSELVR